MTVSRFFSVSFSGDGGARPTVRAGRHGQRASREGVELLVDGQVYGLKGLANGERFTLANAAERLLAAYLAKSDGFFERLEGQGTVTIVERERVRVFRGALAPAQIFFSDRFLSNRLFPVYEASGRPERDAGYFLEFLLDRRSVHFNEALTPFKKIRRLLPGQCLTIKGDGTLTLEDVESAPRFFYRAHPGQTIAEAAAGVRSLLETAIESRLEAGRPVACELSGGLDSSFIAALVAARVSKVSAVMYSYSKFPSHRFSEECARAVATEFGIDLTVLDFADLAMPELSALRTCGDEPTDFFWQGALFGGPTRAVLPENALLFGGFGADQILMRDPGVMPWLLAKGELRKGLRLLSEAAKGLERSRAHLLWQSSLLLLSKPVYRKLSGAFARARFNPFALNEMEPNSLLLEAVPWLKGHEAAQQAFADEETADRARDGRIRLDFSYLVSPSLNTEPYYEPRGVQTVHPFCDSRLIAHVLGEIDWELIHDWKSPYKNLLREAQRGVVPELVRTRPTNEFVFNGFLASVLRSNQDFLRELIAEYEAPGEVGLEKQGMQATLEELLFGLSNNTGGKLLNAIGYELWWRGFRHVTLET